MIFLWPETYVIYIPKGVFFPEVLVFKQCFWFSGSKLAPKMNQICNLWVHSIWVKIQTFEVFFKYCVCLIGRLPLIKISARLNNIWRSNAQNPYKWDSFMDTESIRKTLKIFNFTTRNAILMKLTTDIP